MRTVIAGIATCGALLFMGCGGAPEELPAENESSQETPAEPGRTAFAYDCNNVDDISGYHSHIIDWDRTEASWYWNTCGGGPTLSYGTQVCMRNTNNGYSSCGEWWVETFVPSHNAFMNIKIRALDGH